MMSALKNKIKEKKLLRAEHVEFRIMLPIKLLRGPEYGFQK